MPQCGLQGLVTGWSLHWSDTTLTCEQADFPDPLEVWTGIRNTALLVSNLGGSGRLAGSASRGSKS